MKTGNFLRNISPFNNRQDMPMVQYVIKKILAFFLIYGLSAVVGEILIIGVLSVMGYDPLNGVMPTGWFAGLLPLYGFVVFFVVALLYCKLIEKRSIKLMGFNRKWIDYIVGGIVAILLLAVIVCICCAAGALSFEGFASDFDAVYLIALFAGFAIQSLAEETICRGLLLRSLSPKTSLPIAVFVSSTAFAMPHLSSILEEDAQFAAIGVINLYLVSTVFSLLYLLRSNIYIVGGLHCMWNFVLGGVMGLSVSGGDSIENTVLSLNVNVENILSGGSYSLESSIITTAALGITAIILIIFCRKRGIEDGVQ